MLRRMRTGVIRIRSQKVTEFSKFSNVNFVPILVQKVEAYCLLPVVYIVRLAHLRNADVAVKRYLPGAFPESDLLSTGSQL